MKLISILLSIALLFSLGIITSCSNNSENKSTSATNSEAKANTKSTEDANAEKFDWDDALDAAIAYIDGNGDGIEMSFNDEDIVSYKILPSKDGRMFFVRFMYAVDVEITENFNCIVFSDGKVDSYYKTLEKYKDNFAVDISSVTDEELNKQKSLIQGSYNGGSEFDV